MGELVFRVKEEATGWWVVDGEPIGPFMSKEQAVNLASGMVDAIRASGQSASYQVEAELEQGR